MGPLGRLENRQESELIGLDVQHTDKKILIPLTSSLYVPGRIKDTDNVLVDVGTGYFVEKVRAFFQKTVEPSSTLNETEELCSPRKPPKYRTIKNS